MLVKRSRKNQVVLPKAILERAGLGEEKIPPEALARFEANALKREPGDRVYGSMDALIKDLHRTRRAKKS